MRFGLLAIPRSKDQPPKKLTYSRHGKTNSTVVRIDGAERLFGLVNNKADAQWVIPAESITRPTVTIKQIAVTAGRDINMFRYWFYQPK